MDDLGMMNISSYTYLVWSEVVQHIPDGFLYADCVFYCKIRSYSDLHLDYIN